MCDCGHDAFLCLEDEEDIKGFCGDVLMEHTCPDAAIFCSFRDGRYMAVVKQPEDPDDDEGERLLFAVKPTKDRNLFSDIDAEFRLCCYGMITEIKPGEWRIEE
jgi:hypothetical protein